MSSIQPSLDARNKAILVKNIPPKTSHEKLIIHFQKRNNGGCGDVQSITYPRSKNARDEAVVVFESHETMKSVLARPMHSLNGSLLNVTEFPQQNLLKTKAFVSELTMYKLSCIQDAYSNLTDTTGVSFKLNNGKLYITGLWYQVNAAVDRIEDMIVTIPQSFSTFELDDAKRGAMLSEILKQIQATDQDSSCEDSSLISVPVDQNVFSLMKKNQPTVLSNIEKKYKIKINDSGSDVLLILKQSPMANPNRLTDAESSFKKYYSRFSSSLVKRTIKIKRLPNSTPERISEVIGFVNGSGMKSNLYKVYISQKKDELIVLAMSETEAENGVRSIKKYFPPSQNKELCSYNINSKVKVVIVHGHFQNETADALISEVDFMGAGKIVAECDDSMKSEINNWARLSQNDIRQSVGSGAIQCKNVIHYSIQCPVSVEMLGSQICKSIQYANAIKVTSIAIPVNCLGEGLASKDTRQCIFNTILSFLTGYRRQKISVGISEIRLVVEDSLEAQDFAHFLADKLGMDSSSSASSSESVSGSSSKSDVSSDASSCAICLDDLSNDASLKTLPCQHAFHQSCIDKAFTVSKKCPMCMRNYGKVEGTQPRDGRMKTSVMPASLPGYRCNAIKIEYRIPNGTQGPEHPNPGRPYYGTSRTAYLPNDRMGNELLDLLRKAFDARLIFTVGRSVTTGIENCVTWNDIHHKTNMTGGPSNFGYPDPTYLTRLRQELADKGITS